MEVYYSEMDTRLHRRIIFEGQEDEFLDQLATIPLNSGNYLEMKQFIQEVENMHIEIANLITYISMDDKSVMNQCLNWTVNIKYSF
jgi:hypothetical protein